MIGTGKGDLKYTSCHYKLFICASVKLIDVEFPVSTQQLNVVLYIAICIAANDAEAIIRQSALTFEPMLQELLVPQKIVQSQMT